MILSKVKPQKKDDYVQMSAREFFSTYPHMAKISPLKFIYPMLLSDPKYIVRLKKGRIEFGYGEDAWMIS